MKKFTLILIGYLATTFSVIAQESSFNLKADSVIAPLDKSQIPTGILYDRAYPLARLDIFNQQGYIE